MSWSPGVAARVPSARLLTRLVLAREHALGERRPHHLADAEPLGDREHVLLDLPLQHRVLRLVRGERVEVELGLDAPRLLNPLRRPLGDADVEHLALRDKVVERAQRLLERRVRVRAVALVEIDVVRAEPLQGSVALLHDVLPREPAVVGAVAHREVDLRGEEVVVARDSLERAAGDLLGGSAPIHVRRVEEVDAELEGPVDAGDRPFVLDGAPVGEPRAEGDLRDLDAEVAELAVAHVRRSTRSAARQTPRVGTAGFEPAASCSQSRRATRLRYVPRLPSVERPPPG